MEKQYSYQSKSRKEPNHVQHEWTLALYDFLHHVKPWRNQCSSKEWGGGGDGKETSPGIDIQAFHFTGKTTERISKNTLVSINYTVWLISCLSGMRIHIS